MSVANLSALHHCWWNKTGITAFLIMILLSSHAWSQEVVDEWKFVTRRPGMNWMKTTFDSSKWNDANGGLGTRDTPGSRVGKVWGTPDVWMRKVYKLDAIPKKPALYLHHDEDVEVYINGELVCKKDKYTTEYFEEPLNEKATAALKVGENVMAVHCHQTGGGQFIDVHLIEAGQIPKLPEPKRDTSPFKTDLITSWGSELIPENNWTEYPRPQLVRTAWTNLNGHWDYAITSDQVTEIPENWNGKILVPFCLESKLGGVQRLLDPTECLWYHRTFKADPATGKKVIINFEAVDYQCDVYVNGKHLGNHKGGNTAFSVDATEACKAGDNQLVVRVTDKTEQWQLRGKQTLNPGGIWYTQVSGIWQTVWLEEVSQDFIADLKISTNAKAGTITVKPILNKGAAAGTYKISVLDDGKEVAQAAGNSEEFTITVPNAKLWSPNNPHLYNLSISKLNGQQKVIDQVNSYAGIRTVGKTKDSQGNWIFTLNDEPIFHWGPLDQGWWPDGLLTPPSDEAMAFDIQFLKDAGFNMIRKHIKVEPRRYYYHCDKIGMMMWQDQVSGGRGPRWTFLQENPSDADWPENEHAQYLLELDRMISQLENHPCIVCWVPFNEAWGQHKTVEVGNITAKRDPSRIVNIASGGNFWPVGDIVDIHSYPHPSFPFNQNKEGRFDSFVKVVGEFGGHGWPVKEHVWDSDRNNWGYGGLPQTIEELKDRYKTSITKLNELRAQGICGGVYTQTTDVEVEINGLLTYDRKVIKIPAAELKEIHQQLFQPLPGKSVSAN